MHFKGSHQDKRRITYKKEGDRFQCGALCQDGFTYQVYMKNDPAPPKYLKQGLSSLHSRLMALSDSVEDEYHHCAMNSLYNSAAFCKAVFNHEKKVMCHGVTRKRKRVLPKIVLQEEEENRKVAILKRYIVKVAVLKGDTQCPDLVASSVYDIKPVHFWV